MLAVDAVLSAPPLVIGVALAAGVGLLVVGWRVYQRCPHCGHLVRRVAQGWRRCGACGRQYRKGLRVR
ncbi:MAG TPA: hypothetical protein VKG64_16015 [Methylomirabilota bacterium]|jgi:ribosomal protein L37AE/L43A|nr:hypothetical protein [Methylomirabilota bacterium]